MRVYGSLNSGSATGGAGVATSNISSPTRLIGRILGVYVKYNDAPPATTDVVIRTLGTSPAAPSMNILTISNGATDGWFFPRTQIHTVAGAEIADQYDEMAIYDNINVSIAGANDGDSVDVWLLLAEI